MASTPEKPGCAGYLMLREKDTYTDESLHRAACHGDSDYEAEGKYYCLMHAPTKDKAEEFEKALQEKLVAKDCNFRGAWFPQNVDFSRHNFKGEVNFNLAVFSGSTSFREAQFGGVANFKSAQFSGGPAYFREAKFSGGSANFESAQFSGGYTSFRKVQFSGGNAYFNEARFSKTVSFEAAVFEKSLEFENAVFERQVFFDEAEFKMESFADLGLARFMDFTRFMKLKIENGAELYFGEATFEKPERVLFHSIPDLQPRWFINVDTRKFNFESVDFPLLKKRTFTEILKMRTAAEKQLKETRGLLRRHDQFRADDESPHKLLITAYRRLAANAEENNRYDEAMGFRYLAMETHRRINWWRRFLPVTLHWWYWASSGYGERAWRAAAMLMLVWLVPFLFYVSTAAVYTRVETKRDEGVPGAAEYHISTDDPAMPPGEAVLYSLNTMAFQKPEPKASKTSSLTQWIVFIQTILGPLQATLLALAIRRKFMR